MSLLRKFFLRGSAKGATTEGDVTSTNIDANTQAVDVVIKGSLPLASGAATEAKQDSQILELQAIEQAVDEVESKISDTNLLLADILLELNESESKGATATVATVAQSVASVTLLASEITRKEAYIYNTASKNLWISFVSPAVVGKGIRLAKDEVMIEDVYTGNIYGIWDGAGSDNAQVTQVTP
jgi:hypothetical protein